MSSRADALLAGLEPIPLLAIDTGRFPDLAPLPANDFSECRMPLEAQAGWLIGAGYAAQGHTIAQALRTREACYWHAIYHRLEPDFWNAKYWFRQVENHPTHPQLSREASVLGYSSGKSWDGSRFVDFVEQSVSSNNPRQIHLAESVQWLEWNLLFRFCVGEETH